MYVYAKVDSASCLRQKNRTQKKNDELVEKERKLARIHYQDDFHMVMTSWFPILLFVFLKKKKLMKKKNLVFDVRGSKQITSRVLGGLRCEEIFGSPKTFKQF